MTMEIGKLGITYIQYITSIVVHTQKENSKLRGIINFKTIKPERVMMVNNIIQIKIFDEVKYETETHIEKDIHGFYFVLKTPASCIIKKHDISKETKEGIEITPSDDFIIQVRKRHGFDEPDGIEFGIEKEYKEEFDRLVQNNITRLDKKLKDKEEQMKKEGKESIFDLFK